MENFQNIMFLQNCNCSYNFLSSFEKMSYGTKQQ